MFIKATVLNFFKTLPPKITKNLIKSLPKPDFSDISLTIGAFLLGKGLYMIYPPVMYVVLGLGFIWLGWPKRKVVN